MAAIPTHDARDFLRFLRAQPLETLVADDARLLTLLVQQVVRRAIEPEFVPAFLDAILLAHFTSDNAADSADALAMLPGGDLTPDHSHLTPQSPSPYPSPSLSPASPPLDPQHLQHGNGSSASNGKREREGSNGHSHPNSKRERERAMENKYKTVVPRDAFFQQFVPKSSSHGLCGYVFQRNDIAFNCKTCQLDETCVLCLQCYRNGNHEGHDIFFHRTYPGGCCDCGDSEAWDPEGFCIYHGDRAENDGEGTPGEQSDDQPGLPTELLRVADALFEHIVLFFVEMAKKSMDVFDSERVDVTGRQLQNEYRMQLQQDQQHDPVYVSTLDPPVFHVRICNDDVHSDEDLVRSLTEKNIPDPRELVRSIDSNGYEIVAANVSLRDALTLMQELKSEGWHVCVVEDQHIHDENVLLHVIRWVKQIGSLSKPLLNMFYGKLFDTSNPMSAPKEPIQVMFLSDPYFRKESVQELYELYLKLQGDKDPKLKFSVVFAKVYNRMMSKYFCGIGTRDESLFQYGVQIFTTPSIVSHLAELGVLDMLLDTFNVALDLAKSTKLSAVVAPSRRGISPEVLSMSRTLDCDHSLLKFRRFTYTTDNIGYVFNIPSVASEILLRKDLLRKWFDALRQVQGLDPQNRVQDGHAHVTYETQLWFTAFSFHSTITKLLSQLVKGLRNDVGSDEGKHQMINNVLECFWEQLDVSGIANSVLQLYTPPFGYLMGARQEKIVKFDVGSQPVSFHYPLHSLLASFLLESLYYGPGSSTSSTSLSWLSDWKSFIEGSIARFYNVDDSMDQEANNFQQKKEMLIYGLMEYPLRTLVLCAQIHSGLWIRNGQSMHRQMVNYMSPPWCSELRDLDLFLLQISTGIVGFAKFFTIYFDRFGLSEWLLSLKNSRSSISRDFPTGGDDDKLVTVLEAALLQLIWIITELPPPLDAMKDHDIVLRREIIHRLTQHPCRLSELLDQTSFMVSTAFGGVAARHEKQHLARLERILDEVADVQVKRSSLMSPFLPGGDAANDGGGVMEPNKYVLKKEYFREYDPGFYHLSRSGHEKAQFARQEALFKTWKIDDTPIPMVEQIPPGHASLSSIRFMVLEKGFIGILRLLLEDAAVELGSQPKRTNLTVVLRVIHLINIMVLVLKHSNHQSRALPSDAILPESKKRQVLALLRSGADTFEEDDDWRGKKRVRRQPNGEGEADVQMSSDSDQGEQNYEVQELSVISLLVTFAKDQVKNDFDTSKSTVSAIYWILKELSAVDPIIYSFVEHIFYSGDKKQEDGSKDSSLTKAELKKLHQQRAIEAMMARQKAFAQSTFFADMQEDEDDEEDMSTDGADNLGDLQGQHDSGVGSTIVYRPPPVPDCIICSQKKKDDPIMYIGHSQMSQVTAHTLQQEELEEGVDAPSKFPPQIYLTLCGHAVHLHCWKKYFDSVKAQSRFNLEHSQSNVAFDAHFGEFLCPLCQALSSMVVPYVPLSRELTLDDRQKDREALERVFQLKQDTSSILSWISDGLPARLESIETEDDSEFSEDEFSDSEDEEHGDRQQEDVRAMKQFAVSFLETMLRFQPDMTDVRAAMTALKSGFLNTGPQLAHIIWSAVASTCMSVQLSGISSAIYSLESGGSPSAGDKANGAKTAPTNSFSSLAITSILNAPVPCMKTRLAVSLPESLDSQLDPFSPKEDSKLNVLLRSLRRVHLLFKNRKQDFYQAICAPILSNLRLSLTADEWENALLGGPPLQLGQPILGQDLLYLSVAICSSMLHTKAEILLTLRSFCVLHMAQVLIQLSRLPAEDQNDEDLHLDGVCSGAAEAQEEDDMTGRTKEEDLEMQRSLEQLMDRLSLWSGVDIVAQQPLSDDSFQQQQQVVLPHQRLRGYQLMYLFKSACSAFMRQVTLLCRAFFRGENDPDASWCANFVSSLRMSTNFYDLCQQLGLPTIDQVLLDAELMKYLEAAATQLQHSRFASVPEEAQHLYTQTGHVDVLLEALEKVTSDDVEFTQNMNAGTQIQIIRSNLDRIPALPFRRAEDPNGVPRLYFANIRLTRLASLYTDLHCEVLGKSKCKQTWRVVENPALCLACGEVLCAGSECCRRRGDNMGACTYHAITCGSGVGLFFLIRSSSVLLVFGPRSSYFGSPYLDMFGEEDINIRRGRPLYLSTKRMKALQALYANHMLANEVARNRRTSDHGGGSAEPFVFDITQAQETHVTRTVLKRRAAAFEFQEQLGMNAAAAESAGAAGDGSSLGDLANVRELLDFLAQNHLEAVRIDVSEDEGQSNSDGSDGSDEDATTATTARSTARRKFVLRRRRNRGGPSAHAAGSLPSSAPTEALRGDQSNALSDLASVTEMLEFLAQNGLEGVRIEPPNDDDRSSDDDEDGASRNPVKQSRLHDLANVREMLEFLAQNRLERVCIEIPTTEKLSTSTQQQPKKTKKRRRTATVLEKDRVFAKTVYYKTLSTLKELQDEVAQLEAEHKELVASQQQRKNPQSLAVLTHRDTESLDGESGLDLQGLKERYLALVLERDALHIENLALQDQSKSFAQARKNLIQLAGVETRANARAFAEWEKRSERPREDEIRPLTAEYCAQVTDRAYDRVLELRAKSPSSFTWGADLFGWKDFRSTENNCLVYSLEKIFLFQTAVDIANKFWEISTFEDYDQRCYSPSLKVRFHVLQRVDANNVVIYRTIDRSGGENGVELRMKTIVLISRVFLSATEGWITLFVAVDPARVLVHFTNPLKGRTRLEPVREEMWIDNFKWMICEPMGESAQHCKQIFGGVLDGVATANPSQWILEELMVGIRHERGGTGPFTILTD